MKNKYILRNAIGTKQKSVLFRYADLKYTDPILQAIYDSVYRGLKPAVYDASIVEHKAAFDAAKTQRTSDIAAKKYDYLTLAKQPKSWEKWLMKIGVINKNKWYAKQFLNADGSVFDITIGQILIVGLLGLAVWKHKEIIAFFKGK